MNHADQRRTVIAHPLFVAQFDKLVAAVEEAKRLHPDGYRKSPNARLLADIIEIVIRCTADSANKRSRQGTSVDDEYKPWFGEEFGDGRFRLFFRCEGTFKVIAFVWPNHGSALRAYGAKNDAYAVFKQMVDDGNPPDGWDRLQSQCIALDAIEEIVKAMW